MTALGRTVDYFGNGFTLTGNSNMIANTGTGQLDIVEFGEEVYSVDDLIVQNTIVSFDESFADMTFNYSTGNILTFGYDWAGSVDMATTTKVAEPTTLGLLSLGLLGLVRARNLT